MRKQRIFIAGHRGMVGSAIRRQLEQRGDVELVLRTRDELNLLDSRAVHDFFASERIDQVYLAAAKVGGIVANNTYPADFIYQNMMIESNIIHAAHQNDVNKLLFLGSSCICETGKTADGRKRVVAGHAGADQRTLCHCQNRRDQTVRILQPPVRTRLPLGHADQPVRAARQSPSE